ncbi:MAG: hypothetical protein K5857_07990, partial [Lachnospiraceae bacterium]|nr:hypothetical protein [Lachnospiraceae bacterium]
MNKTKKTKNPIWFALAANAATLIVALFAYRPFFEENDDAFLAMIAEGAYGMSEVRLIYVNVILGYLYRFLYSVAPMVRWHSVLQYVFIFMAFTAFTYVIMAICIKRKTEKIAKPLSIVFLLAMAYEGYVSLQYSKTATITASAGFLILLYSLRRRDDKDDVTVSRKELNILDAIAYLLIFYAMLLRDSSFMLAGLLTVPLGLAEFVKSLKAGKGKALARYVFTFLPVLIFLVVFMKVDRIAYDRDASWKSFMEYNDTR